MTAPRILVRADGGVRVGLGHVRRCLSLAGALRRRGFEVLFLVPDEPAVVQWLKAAGMDVRGVPPGEETALAQTRAVAAQWGADALLVDAYGADVHQMRFTDRVVTAVIDDRGDVHLPVDVVIRGVLAPASAPQPAHTTILQGPEYALLASSFGGAPRRETSREVRAILLTLGGTDPSELTPRLARALASAHPGIRLDVVMGPMMPAELEAAVRAAAPAARIHRPTETLFELMTRADLAVTAGGQTLFELAATGLPGMAVLVAENQRPNIAAMERLGSVVGAGAAGDPGLPQRVASLAGALAGDVAQRRSMSASGQNAVDGRGADRVAQVILDQVVKRRAAR